MDDSKTRDLIIVIGVSVLGLYLWQQTRAQNNSPSEIADGTDSAQALQASIAALISAVDAQKREIRRLQSQQAKMMTRSETAYFPATSEGFRRIDTDLAAFAVSIADPRPYGDGTKLTVNLGNVSAADFEGIKLKVGYGRALPTGPDGLPKFEDSEKPEFQTREKEHSVLARVRAGAWNPNTIVLPGIKPDELSFVTIAIEADQVFLSR